ncbi:MAG: energy transducer TonB [Sphingobium sp.]|nr:energy transducer TonB [Sphingobium sp.]
MFGMSERIDADAGEILSFPEVRAAPKLVLQTPEPSIQRAGRYGEAASTNWPVIFAVVLFHAVLIGVLIQARTEFVRHKEAKLVVLNLAPPAPPPPAEAETPPPPAPEVTAPLAMAITKAPPAPVNVLAQAAPVQVANPVPVPAVAVPVSVRAPPVPATVQADDLATRMLSAKPPRYPVESRRKKEQGTVVLALTLGLDGRVSAISVARSSGFPRLDDAAEDAVRSWRWAPTLRDGQAVIVRGRVEIPFILKS